MEDSTRALVARAVKVRAAQSGLTMTALAERLNIELPTLSNRLSGRRRLDTDQLDELAQALDFSGGFELIAYAMRLDEMKASA